MGMGVLCWCACVCVHVRACACVCVRACAGTCMISPFPLPLRFPHCHALTFWWTTTVLFVCHSIIIFVVYRLSEPIPFWMPCLVDCCCSVATHALRTATPTILPQRCHHNRRCKNTLDLVLIVLLLYHKQRYATPLQHHCCVCVLEHLLREH